MRRIDRQWGARQPKATPLRVPRRKVGVRIRAEGGRELEGEIFAPAHGPHGEPGSALDRLTDASEPFLPLSTDRGTTFLNTRWILCVQLSLEDGRSVLPNDGEPIALALALTEGVGVVGTARFAMPPEDSRLLDYLNAGTDFLPVTTESGVVLVNRRFVVSVDELA